MKTLLLIPARGGSKGFPGKNLALLGGIPLVGRAARAARMAASLLGGDCRVVCSTDAGTIAEAARAWGAEVPFLRPAELASDEAKSIDVVFHALEALGEPFDEVVLLQATSPLTEPEDIVSAVRLHRDSGAPTISVCASEHPAEWLYRMDEAGRLSPVLPSEEVHQRQKGMGVFRPNGSVYVASPATLIKERTFLTEETRGSLMPASRSVDVDVQLDLTVARAILGAREIPCIEVAGRKIGPGQPCFIIAEAGVNHNRDLEMALRLVDAAAEAGADAVKFQTWITEKLCLPGAKKAKYQQCNDQSGQDQFAMLKQLELPYEWHPTLKARAEERGLIFLSTPDEIDSARFLCSIGVPALKIGSGEVTNLPYLQALAGLEKTIILSTGMASLEEVAKAMNALQIESHLPIALLHCVSAYPAPEEEMNLNAVTTLRDAFGSVVGLSDHTAGDTAAVMGIALGIMILEKHLTLDRGLPGPDHAASLVPDEFAELVQKVRHAEKMLGSGKKQIAPSEIETRNVVSRTLVYASQLEAGHLVKEGDLEALRCGKRGLAPEMSVHLVGRVLRRSVLAGSVVVEEDFR